MQKCAHLVDKMLSNAYFAANIRFDAAKNERATKLQNFANFANLTPIQGQRRTELRALCALRALGGPVDGPRLRALAGAMPAPSRGGGAPRLPGAERVFLEFRQTFWKHGVKFRLYRDHYSKNKIN